MSLTIRHGFAESERARVAGLYWAAFSGKLHRIMGPQDRALAFLEEALDPHYALCARDEDGALLGVAGFRDSDGGLVVGNLRMLAAHYGWVGILWRVPLLMLVEKTLRADTLAMDGIFVSRDARGRGVGTALLQAIKAEARRRGLAKVRLDVVDTNPKARALYARAGFRTVQRKSIGPLAGLYGFRSAETMVYTETAGGAAAQQKH